MRPIQNELSDLILRKTGIRTSPGDSFDALQIDSLGMAELTVEIEKAFGIRVGEDILDVSDIAGLIAYIEERREGRPVP
ncbi:MAG: acyl carrier protein [Pirellulaceae bacterium]